MRRDDLSDQTFTSWTVLAKAPPRKKETYWLCRCVCGKELPIATKSLKRGLSRSCGCATKEMHGESSSDEYTLWRRILHRCNSPSFKDWHLYGGKGIKVEWTSFSDFLRDMGRRPSKLYSIDRIDSNGPYSKENCQWATAKQQARNICTNRMITAKGKTLCLSEWAEATGLSRNTIEKRIDNLGWTTEEAVSLPLWSRPHRP